jgi:ubiquinone/menaquinone biosynthesis C-methylase UbiE
VANESWQLTGSGPDSYEHYQVPSVFGPLAEIFLRHVALQKGQRVLDVACGTGIVARQASQALGPSGSIVGVDLSAKMLEVAATYSPTDGARIDWREGDATDLPCLDEEFDVVLCQQGLQFIPDKLRALAEMYRVLKPAGNIGLCVWRGIEHSPCHSAISAAIKRHASEAIAKRFEAPFGFGDYDQLHSALSSAGFQHIDIQIVEVKRRLLPAAESIPGMIASTPVGPEVASLPKRTRSTIVEEVANALAAYREDDGFRIPQSTHIATATRA